MGVLSHKSHGDRFNPWLGYISRLCVQSPVRARMRRQPINVFLSHWCFSLSLSLSLSLPSSLKATKKWPRVRIKSFFSKNFTTEIKTGKTLGSTNFVFCAVFLDWHPKSRIRFQWVVFYASWQVVFKSDSGCLGWVAQLVGALSHISKGCGFDPWSGHIQYLVAICISVSITGGHNTLA